MRTIQKKSLKQDRVADFTCESEYLIACETSKESIWMKNFIGDLGVVPTVQDPIEIFYDNESAVALTKEPKHHGKSKHIERMVDKLDRLIENLSTIWIGRLHLNANVVRFQREPKTNDVQPKNNNSQPNKSFVGSVKNIGIENRSFASVLNIGRCNPSKVIDSSPAIVLDDECLMERDFSCSLMAKIKDINALPNLYLILSNKGFENVKLTHLGGLWVLLEMDSIETKEKVFKHVGVGSWLSYKSDDPYTFAKIVSSWGELTDVEDSESTTISYKRLCVKVKSNVTINDTIKFIMKGKISWIHVKELEPCSPNFIEEKDDSSQSDDESVSDEKENNSENFINDFELDNEKELDHVSKTSFMHENDKNNDAGALDRNKDKVVSNNTDLQFPPGFPPKVGKENIEEVDSSRVSQPKEDLNGSNEGVASAFSGIKGVSSIKLGGSLLDVMDELIKVGHAMGYNMDGSIQEIKMENIDLFSNKTLWGNFSFNYVFSPYVGYSGGILCAWDPNLFHKDNSTVLGLFVAIRGMWIPSGTKILIISFYAPHDLNDKRMLWEFLGHMIDTWDGEFVLLGDFNEELHDINSTASLDMFQKAKIRWAIEVEGDWIVEPSNMKKEFLNHFSNRFTEPISPRLFHEYQFPNILTSDQLADLERDVTHEEIKKSVWDCVINKYPGHDGFTFEFFHRYWKIIDNNVVVAVLQFFSSGTDIARITRKEPKTGQKRTRDGMSTQEPGV
ncbi:RNA-directed DNA polymerase, eukaryota [Tanacetum coccineum]